MQFKINSDKNIAVVINSGDSNGYGVILNLARKNIPVVSMDSNTSNLSFYSRYSTKKICPDFNKSEGEFIKFLVHFGEKQQFKPVLFVSGDMQLLCVLRHRDKLEPLYHLPMASLNIVETLVDKVQFYQTLDQLGIPHARTFVPKDIREVSEISCEFDYPCIIKPVQSTSFVIKFGNKCLKANCPKELVELYEKVSEEEDDIIIQKEIMGTERYLVNMYFDYSSTPKAVCCYKKIRIHPIDFGNASSCVTVWKPDVVELALKCLKAIKYTGFAEAEIQKDQSDGELKLVEINARSTTQTRLSARCGMNMEYLAYKECLGKKITGTDPVKDKILWIDIVRDILAVFSPDGYLFQKKLTFRQIVNSLKGKKEFAYLAWDDPLPFMVLCFRFIRNYGFKAKNLLLPLLILKKRYL